MPPVDEAIIDRFGSLAADVARGLPLRRDWGPQYPSGHLLDSTAWSGASPVTPLSWASRRHNGCAERWIRTSNEHCFGPEPSDTVDRLRQAVNGFFDDTTTCS
jgi:hypothetical protein